MGASHLWLSALVTLCHAEDVLLMIHGAGSLWITKTGTPERLQWVLEALLLVVLLADVVLWQRTPEHSCIYGILEIQTTFFTANHVGIPPCWDIHGCGVESSFLLTSYNFFFSFELRLAINSSHVREKVITETGRDLVVLIFKNCSDEI